MNSALVALTRRLKGLPEPHLLTLDGDFSMYTISNGYGDGAFHNGENGAGHGAAQGGGAGYSRMFGYSYGDGDYKLHHNVN